MFSSSSYTEDCIVRDSRRLLIMLMQLMAMDGLLIFLPMSKKTQQLMIRICDYLLVYSGGEISTT